MSWTLSKALENLIDDNEILCLLTMGNISWSKRMTNESGNSLRRNLTKRKFLQSIKERKTRYFSNIKRKKNLLTTSLVEKIGGK